MKLKESIQTIGSFVGTIFLIFLFLIILEVFFQIDVSYIQIPVFTTPTPDVIPIPLVESSVTTEVDYNSLESVISFLDNNTNEEIIIRVAYSSETEPHSYQEQSRARGFEIDIVNEIESRWFKGNEGRFELIPIDADARIAAAQTERYGFVVGAISQSTERCNLQDTKYTTICTDRIHMADKAGIMVNIEQDIDTFSNRTEFCNLFQDKKIGHIADTTAPGVFDTCRKKPKFVPYFNRESVINNVADNEVAGYVTDSIILRAYAQQEENLRVISLESAIENLVSERYTFLLPDANEGLKKLLDSTLDAMKCDNTFDDIYSTYEVFPKENKGVFRVDDADCSNLSALVEWNLIRKFQY